MLESSVTVSISCYKSLADGHKYQLVFSVISSAANECDVNNGGCDHNCMETLDSYTCSCYPGYTLELDGHTCSGMNITYTICAIFKYLPFFICHIRFRQLLN